MSESGSERFQRGMSVRREVLGDAHVDRSLAQANQFNEEMQVLVTEIAWGDIWTRPGLDRRTRSLVNLGMLTALNRMHEFGVHVRGAVRNGCTADEIKEVLLQTAIYCSVPSANRAFKIAQEALADEDPA